MGAERLGYDRKGRSVQADDWRKLVGVAVRISKGEG
jgi:hypothetical protein